MPCILALVCSSALAQTQTGWTAPEPKPKINYPLGLVYYEDWNEGYLVGVSKVESLDSYLNYLARHSLAQSWQEGAQRQQLAEDLAFDRNGLIPEITLPKIPFLGESKIDIAGQDRITFGGKQTLITGLPQLGQNQSWLPELKMEQALKINLNGSIGDKTKVFLDHDSERQFESKDKIRLSYAGTEDEIVQSVEAGDVQLAIPGSGYTGDLPSHKGLFGISARGKLGGIDLYAVAAREQSESQTQEFRLKNQSHVDTIYDTDFMRYTFYQLMPPESIVSPVSNLRVYVDDGNPYNNTGAQHARATVYPDRPADSTAFSLDRFDGFFDLKMVNTDFLFTPNNGIIEFIQPISSNYTIGVSYIMGPDTVGGYNWFNPQTGETLYILKLIKPQRPDSASLTWNLELKSIYRLSGRDIKLDTLHLIRALPGQNPVELDENGGKFTRLIGLDPDGDDIITWPQLDKLKGYLIPDKTYPFISESLTVKDSIYRLNNPSSYPNRKYFFVVKYSTAKESYNLGQPDIMDGSEKVYVNGALWAKDVDYKITYSTGELSFIRTLPTDADIRVTFEYTPLFSLAEKSLVGTRAEWKFADNGKLGSSVFYRTEGINEDKPGLGSEPFRRMVAETDIGYDLSSAFVTSLLDKVPLVRVDAPTTFHIGGEGALSLPDPNTKGAAYLDDFEGTTISRDVSTRNRLWQFSSVPVDRDTTTLARNRLFWLNPPRIAKESIFGSGIGEEGRETVEFLRVCFQPDNLASWAGIVNCPSRLGMNLTELENLEAVFRTRRAHGRVHVTVGTSIDEDAPRRRKDGTLAGYNSHEDTEDKNRNGVLDATEGEDTGIDGVPGADNQFPSIPGDDGNDDYDLNTNSIGTEGNAQLDGEDLMGSGWTRNNDYYEYSFSLDDTAVVKNLANGWHSLRIPLHDSLRFTTVGSPRLEDIRLVRVWFDSFPQADTLDFYQLQFVGSRWRNPSVVKAIPQAQPVETDEVATVSLISKKTDTGYNPPFEPKKDATGVTELEAALKLGFEGLRPEHRAIVRKASLDHDDYRDYQVLRVYVHNDASNPDFFLQVGSDSINYYEYRQTISSAQPVAGRPDWYEVLIGLDTLPVIKYQVANRPDSVKRLDTWSVAGNPSLADVRYMALGVENTAGHQISGNVWIDDIRLVSPRKDIGVGFNATASLRLSDLASLGLSYRYEDPNFRRFSEGRGVKTGGFGNTIALNADAALDRLLPASWGLSLPVNYQRGTGSAVPKFSSTYPDLRLRNALAAYETAENLSESYSFSLRKNRSTNKLLNYTIEALNYSFRGSRGYSRSLLDSTLSSGSSHALGYSVSPDLSFKIGETEISYFPQGIHVNAGLADNRSPSWHRNGDTTAWGLVRNDSTRNFNYDAGLEYSPISDVSFNFSQNADFDRTDSGHVVGIPLGQESGRDNSFSVSFDPDLNEIFGEKLSLGDIITPRFDFDGSYTEDRPRFGGHYGERRNADNEGSIDLSSDFDLPEALAKIGGLRDKRGDAKAKPGSPQWLFMQLEKSSNVLSAIDLNYSYSQTSNYTDITRRPSFLYRLGLTDIYYENESLGLFPQNTIRERNTEFSASTGIRVADLDARLRFDQTWNRDVSGSSNQTMSYNVSWPDITLSLGKVEKIAPRLLTSSSVSAGYQRRVDFAGTYLPNSSVIDSVNRRISTSDNFSPLLSWQANWKAKFNTTLSANFARSRNLTYLEPQRATESRAQSQGASLNLGYTFSAPQGLKIPFLKRFKFTSDLSVNWGLNYGTSRSSTVGLDGIEVISDNSRDIGTTISLSYRFSRSIEAGLNGGYSAHRNIQRGINTGTTDVNFWVLFKF